jgi:hypothetical protein
MIEHRRSMRGALAAACAAALMGLAPPAALAFASLGAAGCAAEQDVAAVCQRSESASAGRSASVPSSRRTGRELVRAVPHRERAAAWRVPSGPAPSQAPPARG